MSPVYLSQESFNGGEISDKLTGMVHFDKYRTSLQQMVNFIPLPQGPAQSRPGFRYIANANATTGQVYLRPFVAANSQAFILEFGDQYIRFYQNQAQVQSNSGPLQVATPYAYSDVPYLTFAQLNDVMYIFHNNYAPMKLIWSGGTSWSLQTVAWLAGPFEDINTTTGINITPSGTSGTITLTATTNNSAGVGSGASAILNVVNVNIGFGGGSSYIQSVSVSMLSGGGGYNGPVSCAPSSGGGTGLTFTPVITNGVITGVTVGGGMGYGYTNGDTIAFSQTEPANLVALFTARQVGSQFMLRQNGGTTTTNFGALGSGSALLLLGEFIVNVTALSTWEGIVELQVSYDNTNWFTAAVFSTSTEQDFSENRIGVYYRLACTQFTAGSASCTITQMQQIGIVKISAYNSPSQVTGNVIATLASATATPFWAESALDGNNGYPSCGCFEGGRFYLSGTPTNPTTIWGSWVGDFENFAPGDTDDSPVTFNIADFSNPIRWLFNHNNFLCGTMGEEATLDMGVSGAVTPSNPIVPKVTSTYGTQGGVRPLRVGPSLVFAGFGGQSLLALAYMFITNTYEADDLNDSADHLFRQSPIMDMAWQEKPYKILWCLNGEGLAGCTYNPKQKVIGWHRTTTTGQIQSIACIPSTYGDTNGRTELWASVARTINGSNVITVELMSDYEGVTAQANYIPLDCAITFSFGHPSTSATIPNMDFFDGQEVWVYADGAPYGPFTVTGGTITLPLAVHSGCVGLPMPNPTLCSLDLEGGAQNGISQTRTRDIQKATLRVRNTFVGGLKIGLDADNTVQLSNWLTDMTQLDSAPPLFTGDVDLDDIGWPANTARKATFFIEQTLPAPACINLVVIPMNIGD